MIKAIPVICSDHVKNRPASERMFSISLEMGFDQLNWESIRTFKSFVVAAWLIVVLPIKIEFLANDYWCSGFFKNDTKRLFKVDSQLILQAPVS